ETLVTGCHHWLTPNQTSCGTRARDRHCAGSYRLSMECRNDSKRFRDIDKSSNSVNGGEAVPNHVCSEYPVPPCGSRRTPIRILAPENHRSFEMLAEIAGMPRTVTFRALEILRSASLKDRGLELTKVGRDVLGERRSDALRC